MTSASIDYSDGDTRLRGYYAPAVEAAGSVLVVPEAPGLGPMPRRRADMLAALGYNAFAMDLYGDGYFDGYGDGVLAQMDTVASVPGLLLRRVEAGLAQLKTLTGHDADKLVAIGYCFGGTGVLDLARSGAALAGVVCFHGVLATPAIASPPAVSTRILVCTGDRPLIPVEQISAFSKEMEAASADYQILLLGGAGHAFTSHDIVGERKMPGFGYCEDADRRSWRAMQEFFGDVLPG